MAITLGTFTKLDDGAFTGILKTLHVTAALTIIPTDKVSENAPDHRVYAGQRYEVGAAWSQVAKSSGETYLNLKIGAPDYAEMNIMRSGGVRVPVFRRFRDCGALHNPEAGTAASGDATAPGWWSDQRDQTRA